MATQIYNDGTQILCVNTIDNTKIVCLDLFTFAYHEHSTDKYILEDGNGTGIKVRLADVQDDEGNTFATSADLVTYLSGLTRQAANLGSSVQLDNMKLVNTGSHLKFIDQNRGTSSFMVQQRVTDSGTQKVFFVEQTDGLVVETSANAFQPYATHTATASANAQGRYVVVIDLAIQNSVFIHEYRAKVLDDGNGNGINNLNIKIFNVTTTPADSSKYRTLAGTGIDGGWFISKNAHYNLLRDSSTDTAGGYNIAIGDTVALPFEEGFSLDAGQHYRFVISGDNQFIMEGVEGAANPFGTTASLTQFIPYIERSYSGEVETEIISRAARVFSDAIDFERDVTNTSIFTSEADKYAVNGIRAVEESGQIKLIAVKGDRVYYKGLNHDLITIAGQPAGATATDVVNALNALFSVTAAGVPSEIVSPTVDVAGVATTNNAYANVVDPIGDASFALGSGTHGVVYSDEYINEPGEYYTFSILGKNYHGIGLFDASKDSDGNLIADHLEELQSGTTNRYLGNQFSMWIHLTVAAWTYYGENTGFAYLEGYSHSDTTQRWQTSAEYTNLATQPVSMKVGIDVLGYLYVAYWNAAHSRWIKIVRTSYTLTAGQYGLYYAMGSTSSQMYDAPKIHLINESAPLLTYHYIESAGFNYPLFNSQEEANYIDTENGGAGASVGIVFPDDPSATIWYKPVTGYTDGGVSAPANTDAITWNEIPSLDDALFAPAAFSDTTLTVNEGDAINFQVVPADSSFTTTLSGVAWLNLSGAYVQGTAPEVTGDNVANPSDTHTITVTRANEYGSTTGTLTIVVNNLTAPVNPISGFNHVSGTTALIDSDTLGDGSVVQVNTQVADGERFVIEQAYIETNILPNLTASGDQYIIGLHNTASDFSTLELADFDAAIVWEYETATSHTFKFYRDGSVVQNIVINSLTDAFYDYAIEANGTSAWLIACNVNSIMNEPSPADGGSFSHTYEVTNAEDTAPLQIHMAALNTTADISTTGISTITTPAAPVGNLTAWTKAIDFSGSNEHLKQVSTSDTANALRMGGLSVQVPVNADSTKTTNDTNARPFATTIVFKADRHSSNQHIWNSGEGTSTGDDNIYLRLDASGNLYFGWGREGVGYNECRIAQNISSSTWYGVYIAHKGYRPSGAAASSANLSLGFDIRLMSSTDSFNSVGTNLSTASNWISTGVRMDRTVLGDFTIGGRGGNRNFQGKVASMVITTLRIDFTVPNDAEIKLMITDPKKWEDDYRVGNFVRRVDESTFSSYTPSNRYVGHGAVQIYLMGDGSSDSFSNGIRNEVYPTDQNYTKLQFNNMASNDIETVNITGLT